VLAHQGSEARHERIDVARVRSPSVTRAPGGGDLPIGEQRTDVVDLGLAHVAARGGGVDGDAGAAKRLDQCLDRGLAAEIDHRAGPIEDDEIEAILEAHAAPPSMRLAISSSPIAKPVDAPAPQVTMAMRTDGCGASNRTFLSAADA